MDVYEKYRLLTEKLIASGLTAATAESCTSGTVASLITDTPGASAVLKGAFTVYCNEAKVPNIYIDNHIQIIKCDSLKYIAFPIAKNGCSCLIKSALVYDGIDTAENNDFIWQNYSKYLEIQQE